MEQPLMLTQERARASFSVDALSSLLLGDTRLAMKDKVDALLASKPQYNKAKRYFSSKAQQYKNAAERYLLAKQELWDGDLNDLTPAEQAAYIEGATGGSHPVGGAGMFIPTLKSQGSEEQWAKWGPLAEEQAIIGCYAQTEIAHGSNVRGLQTTATFVPEADLLEIHTPSLTALKWWPGGLGLTCTHAVVYARLLVPEMDGLPAADHGIKAIMVQLRDLETHEALPGIQCGDIGLKFGGRGDIDNGFCRFTHLRVPRANLLCKYSQLHRDGSYTENARMSKMGYSAMMLIRSQLVGLAGTRLQSACTIALRYLAVRRQFSELPSTAPSSSSAGSGGAVAGEETVVLDYQSVQMRTIPLLATAYALHFTGKAMALMHEQFMAEVNEGGTNSRQAQTHAMGSALKCAAYTLATDGVEALRRACGGHGYSTLSGLTDLVTNTAAGFTTEGDAFMLIQQTSRYLLRAIRAVVDLDERKQRGESDQNEQAAQTAYPGTEHLRALSELDGAGSRCAAGSVSDWAADAGVLAVQALAHRSARSCLEVDNRLQEERDAALSGGGGDGGMDVGAAEQRAQQAVQWEAVQMSFAYADQLIALLFHQRVTAIAEDAAVEQPIKRVLSKLCALHALHTLTAGGAAAASGSSSLAELLACGYLSPEQARSAQQAARQLTLEVRPEVVALVDAFRFSDDYLNSAIGRYDGDVYTALYEWAQENPMNDGPDGNGVVDGYAEFIRPLLDRGKQAAEARGAVLADATFGAASMATKARL